MKDSIFALAGLTLLSASGCQTREKEQTCQPNIVFILADDLGYGDLSCYGQERFKTPYIDQLAAEGVRFTDFYSGSAVCAPSRSCLLTGLHSGHAPIRGNKEFQPEGQQPMPEGTTTMATLLKSAGYTNGIIGKWGLGYPGSGSEPLDMGFDYFFGNNCQRHAHSYFVDYLWENREKVYFQEPVYSHDELTRKGLEFIKANQKQPFFLYLAYAIPHAEMVLPDEYLEPFKGEFPEPNPWPSGRHYGEQPYPRAALAAMISHLDSDVGKIMELLKELGIDENTLVVFTSDNGPAEEGGNDPDFFNSNGPFKGLKRDLYEGGIRVPFITRYPGVIPEGRVSGHVAALWDVLPTLVDLTGIEADYACDGISMMPALKGNDPEQAEHEYLYWEFHELGGRQAIRKGQWKGVKYGLSSQESALELYNLEDDPGETSNLADAHPEIVLDLEQKLLEARVPSEHFPFPKD